jgi:hypothetical protein
VTLWKSAGGLIRGQNAKKPRAIHDSSREAFFHNC